MSGQNFGITIDVGKWRSELLKLRVHMLRYAKRYFGTDVAEALSSRFSNALGILKDYRSRILSILPRGSGVVMIMASSNSIKEGVESVLKMRRFDGLVIERRVGVPLEESFHIVQVGTYGTKCTCKDAIMTSSKADSEFTRALKSLGFKKIDVQLPIFTKYVLCKHTLVGSSYALALGIIDRNSRVFKEVLKLGILALALRVKGYENIDKKIIKRSYNVILRLSKGLKP